MSLSIFGPDQHPHELLALRQLIFQLAPQCGLDLGNRASVRHFLDQTSPASLGESYDPQLCRELHAMLILLFRLETSSSEDVGIEGLRRLWHQHDEILTRFQGREAPAAS